MYRSLGVVVAIVVWTASTAQALSIYVGTHWLLDNTSGQVVDIYVQADGGEQVAGLKLVAQLGDGGPALGGGDVTPAMTADIIGPGTLFAANNVGAFDSSVPPSFVEQVTATNFGTIGLFPGANLLATLTFDTTGFVYGLWPLQLSGTVDGDTGFFDVPIDITNGFIWVEPEPGAIVTASLALVGLCAVALRRRSVPRATHSRTVR